jgi:hypothetical protein
MAAVQLGRVDRGQQVARWIVGEVGGDGVRVAGPALVGIVVRRRGDEA